MARKGVVDVQEQQYDIEEDIKSHNEELTQSDRYIEGKLTMNNLYVA